MKWMNEWKRRIAVLLRGNRFDRDLAEEMEFHRALEAEDNERHGMEPRAAQAAASRRLGNALRLREESRDQWGWGRLDRLDADLRFGLRMLARNPGYTAAAVLTLALAIGANSLMFSVADALVFRPLPFPHPERLALVWSIFNGTDRTYVSLPDFHDYAAQNRVFDSMGASAATSYTIDVEGFPDTLYGGRVTAGFFPTLGIQAHLGRIFTAEDERPGAESVIVLSDRCWRTRFHADPGVVGSKLLLRHRSGPRAPYTVVGVLRPEFEVAYPRYSDIWGAMPSNDDQALERGGGFSVIARLKPGVTFAAANSDMQPIALGLASGHADPGRKMTGAQVLSLQENLIGDSPQYMRVMLGAVGFVLLLACANVANLTLARGADREREMTIRAAIGAGRARLFRQILTESVLLSLAGGIAGALVAYASVRWIRTLIPPRALRGDQIAVDARVLFGTLAISLVTGILVGLAPALRGSRARLHPALQTPRHSVLRSALVVAEVALGFVLVTGAGLMINSYIRLLRVDPGFARRELLLIETHADRRDFPDPQQRAAAVEDMLAAVSTVPGVRSAGVSDFRPLGSVMNYTARKSEAGARLAFTAESIAGDYFESMGIALLRGRIFTRRDGPTSQPVAVINDTAAARYWPGEDPLGKTLLIGRGKVQELAEIVGIVGSVRRWSVDRPPDPSFYVPRSQFILADHLDLVVRPVPGIAAAPLAPVVRSRMAAVSRNFAADSVHTIEALMDEQLARPRFSATVLGIFGFLALALTVTGVYGVTSYTVRARRREIGIRVALGANRRRVLSFVMRRSSRAVALGLVLGLLGALATTRVLTRLLYLIKPLDIPTFLAVGLLLALFAWVGSYLPARRAATVDPMESVRCD
jgi:putative ABC transport system permease protein